jgi:hypothetical protein
MAAVSRFSAWNPVRRTAIRDVAHRSRCASCSCGLICVNGRGGPPVARLKSALSKSKRSCFSSFALAASIGARNASALPATSRSAALGGAGRRCAIATSSGGMSAEPRASTRSATAAKMEYSSSVKNCSGARASRSRVLRSASGTAPAAASRTAPPIVFLRNPRRVSTERNPTTRRTPPRRRTEPGRRS